MKPTLDHIGIFVRSLQEASEAYEHLGLSIHQTIDFRRANGRTVRVGLIELANGIELELLEDPDAVDEGTPVLNHICFRVDDIEGELKRLKTSGVPLESDVPRPGITSSAIAFLRPEAAGGVRIELAQGTGAGS